ncbi:MAG TPA: response regulator [Deltaproteobacteria bacterium]|nr:response regulator [Deltaproteobacteria bacterium]
MEPSRKIRVLLVDDEKDFADILAKRLEVRDFYVTCVYNGDDAIARIQSEGYDVVVLDVLMPGKSGLDILKEMKAINPLMHIIMLTGHARVDTAIEGMELGAYDYLIKPAETEDLVEKIRLANSHKTSQEERIRLAKTMPASKKRGWKKFLGPISDLLQKDRTEDTDETDDA